MERTATFNNAKVDGVDPDIPSCDHIDEIENDRRLPFKRRRGSSAAHTDAVRSHTASPVSSKRLHYPIICKEGSKGERGNVPGYDLTYVNNNQIV